MSRSRLVAYWVTTGLVASSMVSGGVAHVLHVQASVDGFVRLGELLLDLFDMAGANSSRSAARPNQSQPAIHEAQGRRKAREKSDPRRGR
jgi:hypothetical protein